MLDVLLIAMFLALEVTMAILMVWIGFPSQK
jgi:hypothetical protein